MTISKRWRALVCFLFLVLVQLQKCYAFQIQPTRASCHPTYGVHRTDLHTTEKIAHHSRHLIFTRHAVLDTWDEINDKSQRLLRMPKNFYRNTTTSISNNINAIVTFPSRTSAKFSSAVGNTKKSIVATKRGVKQTLRVVSTASRTAIDSLYDITDQLSSSSSSEKETANGAIAIEESIEDLIQSKKVKVLPAKVRKSSSPFEQFKDGLYNSADTISVTFQQIQALPGQVAAVPGKMQRKQEEISRSASTLWRLVTLAPLRESVSRKQFLIEQFLRKSQESSKTQTESSGVLTTGVKAFTILKIVVSNSMKELQRQEIEAQKLATLAMKQAILDSRKPQIPKFSEVIKLPSLSDINLPVPAVSSSPAPPTITTNQKMTSPKVPPPKATTPKSGTNSNKGSNNSNNSNNKNRKNGGDDDNNNDDDRKDEIVGEIVDKSVEVGVKVVDVAIEGLAWGLKFAKAFQKDAQLFQERLQANRELQGLTKDSNAKLIESSSEQPLQAAIKDKSQDNSDTASTADLILSTSENAESEVVDSVKTAKEDSDLVQVVSAVVVNNKEEEEEEEEKEEEKVAPSLNDDKYHDEEDGMMMSSTQQQVTPSLLSVLEEAPPVSMTSDDEEKVIERDDTKDVVGTATVIGIDENTGSDAVDNIEETGKAIAGAQTPSQSFVKVSTHNNAPAKGFGAASTDTNASNNAKNRKISSNKKSSPSSSSTSASASNSSSKADVASDGATTTTTTRSMRRATTKKTTPTNNTSNNNNDKK